MKATSWISLRMLVLFSLVRLCFANNSLAKVTFGNNFYWANNWKIAETINNITNVTGLTSLIELDVNTNNFTVNMTAASIHFPNLQIVDMSNNFVNIPPHVSLCQDKEIHSLRRLDLSNNKLDMHKLPMRFIEHCVNLVELSLARNYLHQSLFISLEGASSLAFIDLSSNQLEYIGPDFAKELDRANVTIDISDNPLQCSCSFESRAFVQWVSQDRKTQIKHFDKLLCSGPNGQQSLKTVERHPFAKSMLESYSCNNQYCGHSTGYWYWHHYHGLFLLEV